MFAFNDSCAKLHLKPLEKDEKWRIWLLKSVDMRPAFCLKTKKELNSIEATKRLVEDEVEKIVPNCIRLAITLICKSALP